MSPSSLSPALLPELSLHSPCHHTPQRIAPISGELILIQSHPLSLFKESRRQGLLVVDKGVEVHKMGYLFLLIALLILGQLSISVSEVCSQDDLHETILKVVEY